MRMLVSALILFFAHSAFAAPTANDCRRFFNYSDGTKAFISYVEAIAEAPELKVDLPKFYSTLIDGKLISPISLDRARVSPSLLVHYQGLQKVLDSSAFDLRALKNWASRKLAEGKQSQQERSGVERETHFSGIRPHFIRTREPLQAKGGQFADVSPYPLEISDHDVTQQMWLGLMGDNPSNQRGPAPIFVKYKDGPVVLAMDYPAENMSFWSALVFANIYSQSRGLPPAYDLDGIQFVDQGSNEALDILEVASRGVLSIKNEEHFDRFLEKNRPEDVVLRSGYRLPTDNEVTLLMKKLTTEDGRKVEELRLPEIKEYTWINYNSLSAGYRGTVPVGQTHKSFTIDGQVIHDFYGNIKKWVYTFIFDQYTEQFIVKWKIGMRGVGHSDQLNDSQQFFKSATPQAVFSREYLNGIRLVRSVVP